MFLWDVMQEALGDGGGEQDNHASAAVASYEEPAVELQDIEAQQAFAAQDMQEACEHVEELQLEQEEAFDDTMMRMQGAYLRVRWKIGGHENLTAFCPTSAS